MIAKQLILGAALAAFSFSASAAKPFRSVIPMQVICVTGGAEGMLEIMLEKFNEKPAHSMNLTMRGTPIHMYITENRNNPSSSVILHSPGANQTCLFWDAKDFLRTIETESLPAKKPSEETDA